MVLERERLPPEPSGLDLWKARYDDIVSFERHLVRNGTVIGKRLLGRIDSLKKNWKISPSDIQERSFWKAYQHVYEQLLTRTNTEFAPWYIIPADRKWFTRAAVADVIVARLQALGLSFPIVPEEERSQLAAERKKLADEAHPDAPPSLAAQSS